MSSIKVKFRPSSLVGREGSIYYQIIHERTVRQLSTPYTILAREWDKKHSSIAITPDSPRLPKILSIREAIKHDTHRLIKIVHTFQASGADFSADDIIDEYRRRMDEYSFYNYMQAAIISLRQNGKISTACNYKATLSNFRKFLSDTSAAGEMISVNITLDCITSRLMERYEAWLHNRGIAPNTSSFYLRILRAVYNRAVDDDIIDNIYPFRRVYTGVDKTIKRAIPLTDIKKIKTLNLNGSPRLDFARDMFMMSFYLRGMSFIDMAFLLKTDLKNGTIIYRRRKTNQQLTIEWTPQMQAILDKYDENPTPFLLPILTKRYKNNHTAYRSISCKINHELKHIARMAGIDVTMTMYVARHSWASAAKSKGIPISIISEGMGHDSETTTQIYLASLATSAINNANTLIMNALD